MRTGTAIVFEAQRSGYGIDQIADKAITVGELIDILSDCNEDDIFVLSHDGGYIYGSVSRMDGRFFEEHEDGVWIEV